MQCASSRQGVTTGEEFTALAQRISLQKQGYDMYSLRRYITNEQGERIGVLLDLEEYRQLSRLSSPDSELLIGLSEAELQALAQSSLAPSEQVRLDDLLDRNAQARLLGTEQSELDRLLNHLDQLNILKTRARYTLAQQIG